MKKGVKVTLLIALSCVVLGIGCLAAAFIISGGKLDIISQQKAVFQEKTYECGMEGLTGMEVRADNNDVVLTLSNDEKIHVTYGESEWSTYAIEQRGDTLRISSEQKKPWYERLLTWEMDRPDLCIALPSAYAGGLDLETDNGALELHDLQQVQTVRLKTDNGRITIENCTLSSVTGQTDNGAISLTDVKTAEGVDLSSHNGAAEAVRVHCGTMLWLKSHNGKIVLDRVSAEAELTFQTSNGSIKGTIVGEDSAFTIVSHTSNGKNNLPESWGSGSRKLNVHTQNGEIKVTFEGQAD